MSERRTTLQAVIDEALAAGLRDLYTMIPAKVVKWDADKQRADCQPLIKNVTSGEEDDREVTSCPVVPGVPVQFIGAGGFRMTCPISDGNTIIEGSAAKATTGMLIFSHRSLDKWLSGNGDEVDPEFDHDHGFQDAVFMPGLMPFGAPWSSCPTDHMTVGYDSGKQAHFHKDTIALGDESGNDWVALAQKVLDELDKIKTAHNSHKHAFTGSGTVGAVDVTYTSASVAASQVKAK